MATLVIHWGKGTNSDVKQQKNQIEFGLGGRKKFNKQEIAMCKFQDTIVGHNYKARLSDTIQRL